MTSSFHNGDIVYGDKSGGDNVQGDKYEYRGIPHPSGRTAARRVILVLSANPRLTSPLHIGEEKRAISRAIDLAGAGDRLETRSADSVRRADLQQALLRHRPTVVHFIGHGTAQRGIVVLDGFGSAQPIPTAAVGELFRILPGEIKCVVLNACFTYELAVAIGNHIPCVVGMRGPMSDLAAIDFASSFYDGVAAGSSIRVAFDLARNTLTTEGHPDADTPALIAAPRVAEHTVIAPCRTD